MPFNVDVNQAMILLGVKTLELEQLRMRAETLVEEFNKLQAEHEALKTAHEALLQQHPPPPLDEAEPTRKPEAKKH